MYPNNNDNFPRKAGGYNLDSYEPAVINPEKTTIRGFNQNGFH